MSPTDVREIAAGIFRIRTPLSDEVLLSQYLVVDDDALLFRTGPPRLFAPIRDAVATVISLDRLRWISFSHAQPDECGSLDEWLAAAPRAQPLCAKASAGALTDRAPCALADGEELSLGTHRVRWLDAPRPPQRTECGYLFETTTRTLLCGDLATETKALLEKLAATKPATVACVHGSAWHGDGAAVLRKLAARL